MTASRSPGVPRRILRCSHVTTPAIEDRFSRDYAHARERFRHAVVRRGGSLATLPLTARGPAGEALTIDVGWFGSSTPSRVVVHSSGVHGVEAFAGAAIQLQWLEEGIDGVPEDGAIVLVHVVNPYGMAWLRRVNEHNVDLNRNCLAAHDAYAGAPDGYEALRRFLNPAGPPPAREWFHLKALWFIARFGLPALKQTIAGGQYVDPRGLFFGGTELEEEPRVLRHFVHERMRDVRHLIGLDVHTGLGPFGVDSLLASDAPATPAFTALRAAYGDRVAAPGSGGHPAYTAKGTYDTIFREALPEATVHFVVQEFGTCDVLRTFRALRTENRRHHNGSGTVAPVESELREIFSPPDPAWRAAVLSRGRTAIDQAMRLLRA